MAAEYPGTIATIASDKQNTTPESTDHPGHHNKMAQEIVATQTELGTNPKGSKASVKARLDDVDTQIAGIKDTSDVYTVTNAPAADRIYDAGATSTLDDLKAVFATLIQDLKDRQVIG